MNYPRCLVSTATLTLTLAVSGASCPDREPHEQPPTAVQVSRERVRSVILAYFDRCLPGQYSFLEQVEPTYYDEIDVTGSYRDFYIAMIDAMLGSPHVQINDHSMDACLRWYETEPDCGASTPDVCADALAGTLFEGEACALDVECSSELSCGGLTEDNCGVCTAPADLGEECEEVGCVEGLGCSYPASGTAICVEPAGLGEECEEAPCEHDTYCDYSRSPAVCTLPAGLGERCDEIYCETDLECDWEQAEPVCVEHEPEPAPSVGAACDPANGGCGSWTYTGLACDDSDGDGDGVCVQIAIAEEGEPCAYHPGGAMNPVCRNGLFTTHYCAADLMSGETTGTCQRRPSVGEPCEPVMSLCNGLEAYCDSDSDQCLAVAAEGETCAHIATTYACGVLSYCDDEADSCRPLATNIPTSPEPPVCS